ncbi:MAG TPA: hypothetical protein VGD14_16400 [bacterium]
MKIINNSLLFTLIFIASALAQNLEPFGLQGKSVTALDYYGGALYAGTDGDGLYVHTATDSSWSKFWTEFGLQGVHVRSVYPHDIGPIGWGITVGTEPDKSSGDSVLTYCWSIYDPQWVVSDSNLNRNEIAVIHAFDGFPDPRI